MTFPYRRFQGHLPCPAREIAACKTPRPRFAASVTLIALCAFELLHPMPGHGQATKRKAALPPAPISAGADPKEGQAATEHAYYTVCMNLIQREWEVNHTAGVMKRFSARQKHNI